MWVRNLEKWWIVHILQSGFLYNIYPRPDGYDGNEVASRFLSLIWLGWIYLLLVYEKVNFLYIKLIYTIFFLLYLHVATTKRAWILGLAKFIYTYFILRSVNHERYGT